VLAEVAVEGKPADVFDDLAQRGEPVIGVGPPGARLDVDAQTPSVVLGKRRRRAVHSRAPAKGWLQQVRGFADRANSGGMGQEVPHRRRPEARLCRYQLVAAQVVVGGRIEVDQSVLPQLHHGNRREGLGDGGDPEDRVLGDRCVRRDVRYTKAVEPGKGSVSHHPHGKAGGRPAVEDLANLGPYLELINRGHRSLIPHRPAGDAVSAESRQRGLCGTDATRMRVGGKGREGDANGGA